MDGPAEDSLQRMLGEAAVGLDKVHREAILVDLVESARKATASLGSDSKEAIAAKLLGHQESQVATKLSSSFGIDSVPDLRKSLGLSHIPAELASEVAGAARKVKLAVAQRYQNDLQKSVRDVLQQHLARIESDITRMEAREALESASKEISSACLRFRETELADPAELAKAIDSVMASSPFPHVPGLVDLEQRMWSQYKRALTSEVKSAYPGAVAAYVKLDAASAFQAVDELLVAELK